MALKNAIFLMLGCIFLCATPVQADENNNQPPFQSTLKDVHLKNKIFEQSGDESP